MKSDYLSRQYEAGHGARYEWAKSYAHRMGILTEWLQQHVDCRGCPAIYNTCSGNTHWQKCVTNYYKALKYYAKHLEESLT